MKVRFWAAVLALALPVGLLSFGAVASASPSTKPPGVQSAKAGTGHIAAGKHVAAQVGTKPFTPTAAQQRARDHAMSVLRHLPKPPVGAHPAQAAVPSPSGPQTTPGLQAKTVAPNPNAASNNFAIFQSQNIPASCATSCAQSSVNEPDTANSGRYILQTSNWNIAYTTNGGAAAPTWLYQNPYTLQPGFCCDATVMYVPSRNRYIYEGLTLGTGAQNGFTIAAASGQNPTGWCVYHFSASSFGGTDGNILDYPKIAYANNNMYVTWNQYNSAGSAWLSTGLARIPLDALTNCSGLSYSYLNRTDNFTFGLTMGTSSLDQFYWVSNWYTTSGGSGTSERIFYWPENSGTYFFKDITVASYNFAGGSCASQDGVVTDWCTRLDPRWETAWISRAEYNAQANSAFAGDGTLGVAITAGPAGSDPFPYVIYEYFKLNALTYIQTSASFNNGFAIAYAGCAPNAKGQVGCSMSWGGGTGTTHYYPGGLILLQDNISPTQPWAFSFNDTGSGNATAWGDYQVTQPWNPDSGPFITTEWSVNGSGTVVPREVVWGRAHDFGWFRSAANG